MGGWGVKMRQNGLGFRVCVDDVTGLGLRFLKGIHFRLLLGDADMCRRIAAYEANLCNVEIALPELLVGTCEGPLSPFIDHIKAS